MPRWHAHGNQATSAECVFTAPNEKRGCCWRCILTGAMYNFWPQSPLHHSSQKISAVALPCSWPGAKSAQVSKMSSPRKMSNSKRASCLLATNICQHVQHAHLQQLKLCPFTHPHLLLQHVQAPPPHHFLFLHKRQCPQLVMPNADATPRLLGKLHGLLAPAPAPLARRPHGMLSMQGPRVLHVLLGHGPFWERNGPVDARAGRVPREVAQEVARLLQLSRDFLH